MASKEAATVRAILRDLLTASGYEVIEAVDGGEGVAKAKADRPDLVLMDIQMPVLDGYEATRQIRDKDSKVLNREVTVVALTANVTGGNKERCLTAGMNDFLSKPIHPQQLAEVIRRWHKGKIKTVEPTVSSPEPATSLGVLWDEAELRERYGDDDLLIREILSVFMQDLPERLAELRQAFEAKDAVNAERLTHMIKGSSATIGSPALTAVAREMEELVIQHQMDRAFAMIPQLEKKFLELRQVTEAKLGGS